jgi:hypothetical protein
MILLIIVLILLLAVGGPYMGYRQWGYNGGIGIFGLVLLLLLFFWLFGRGRFL